MHNLNVSEKNFVCRDVSHNISKKYCSGIHEEINLFKRQINANILHTYSKIYDSFCLQPYLSFGLPKSLSKELTKNRISAHDLLIERGRYFRTRIPREQRICVQCNQVEDEEHFFLFCRKYTNLRIKLFNKLNLKIPVLKPNTNECFKLLYELMNPSSAVNTKLICKFIHEVLELR